MRFGPYEVTGELGRGGMGVVYRGRSDAGEPVAIKLVAERDPEILARFDRERRLLAGFTARDGFVPLLDAGVSPRGPYLVMPLVPGGTLAARLVAGPLGVEETIALGRALAAALARAHARGVVHRDLKPENILFTKDGTPLVSDLGLARHFLRAGLASSDELSRSHQGFGTAGYMAPEQVEDAKHVGPPADVFSLGAVLYECLAGTPAFPGHAPIERLARTAKGSMTPIERVRADVPPWLAALVMRSLAVRPDDRPKDARAVLRALEARDRGPRVTVARVLAAAATVLLLAGGALLLARRSGPAPPPRVPPPPPPRSPVTPPPPTPPAPDVERFVVSAREHLERNEVPVAIEECGHALERDPRSVDALVIRARAKNLLRDYGGSIADCARAIELAPSRGEPYFRRAMAYANRGDVDQAVADAKLAIEREPRDATYWDYLGNFLSLAKDEAGALAAFEREIELAPDRPDAYVSRAQILYGRGDVVAALADLDRAIEIDPRDAPTFAIRASVRERNGDLRGAIRDFEHSLELDPTGQNADDRRRALEALKRALPETAPR